MMTNRVFLTGIVAGVAAALVLAAVFSSITPQSTAQMMQHSPGMMGGGMMMQGTGGQVQAGQWNAQKSPFSANGMSMVDSVQVTGISITGSNEVTVNLRYNGNGSSPRITIAAITNPMAVMGQMHGNMGMMGGGGGGGMMMQGGMMGGMNSGMMGMMHGTSQPAAIAGRPVWVNNTQWQQWHDQMAQWNSQMARWHGQLNSTQWQQMEQWHNQMMAAAQQGLVAPGTIGWTPIQAVQSQAGSAALNSGWSSSTELEIRLQGDGSAYDSSGIHVVVFPLTG